MKTEHNLTSESTEGKKKSRAVTAEVVPKPRQRYNGGRPSTYTEEIASEICTRISLGESLRKITNDDAMPGLRTVMTWLYSNELFQQQYARAKEAQAESFEDMMLEVAHNEDDVARARLIIDTMKWTASKLKPKKYGDKLDVTSGGEKLPTPLLGSITTEGQA